MLQNLERESVTHYQASQQVINNDLSISPYLSNVFPGPQRALKQQCIKHHDGQVLYILAGKSVDFSKHKWSYLQLVLLK